MFRTNDSTFFAVRLGLSLVVSTTIGLSACCYHQQPSAHITAVSLSPNNSCETPGIPYYLPKPLLVVAKNVRHIDESKVGLTNPAPIPNGFDNQASYADLKSNITVPSSSSTAQPAVAIQPNTLTSNFDTTAPGLPDFREKMTPDQRVQDGVMPDSFYTYQIIFVPDLTQKYGLQINGGPGEIRAAMNLVNGWMYTGLGPFYVKDSSTAQNIMAQGVAALYAGRGVADVLDQVGEIASTTTTGTRALGDDRAVDAGELIDKYAKLARALQSETLVPKKMENYAEITIYEPFIGPDGNMEWRVVAHHKFDRDYFQPSLSENASKLLEQIIDADRKQSEAKIKAEENRSLELQSERLPSPEPREQMNVNPRSQIDGLSSELSNDATEDFKRQILGLTEELRDDTLHARAAATPATQVNINLTPEANANFTPAKRSCLTDFFHCKDRPTNQAKIGGIFETTQSDLTAPILDSPQGQEDF